MKNAESSSDEGDELRRLRRRLDGMEARISFLLNEVDTEITTEDIVVPDDVGSEHLDGYVDHIEYVSETEREDLGWSTEAENRIYTAIEKNRIDIEQSDVECGSTL